MTQTSERISVDGDLEIDVSKMTGDDRNITNNYFHRKREAGAGRR